MDHARETLDNPKSLLIVRERASRRECVQLTDRAHDSGVVTRRGRTRRRSEQGAVRGDYDELAASEMRWLQRDENGGDNP